MKIFIHVKDLIGPQNACIGLGQILLDRGHQVYFLINKIFAEKFASHSSQFIICELEPKLKEVEDKIQDDPIKSSTDNFIQLGLFSDMEPIDKINQLANTAFLNNLFIDAEHYEPQIKKLIDDIQPDAFIVDSAFVSPYLMNSKIPWIYFFCSNPLGVFCDDNLPPFCSGYPIDGDRQQWEEFQKVLDSTYFNRIRQMQKKLCIRFGYENANQFKKLNSPFLNIYQFPKELDYDDVVTIDERFVRLETPIRNNAETFELPDKLKKQMKKGDKLIYLSLGSMGSCDLNLMNKLVTILGKTKHWYIVSKGMLHDQYKLADNMWGDRYLPQTKIIPIVDLVIFHGGSNTLIETIYNGKPMIILPLFYDQYNNAQRVDEKNYGKRLHAQRFTEQELIDSIEQLLQDDELHQRLSLVSERMKTNVDREFVCKSIEQLVQNNKQQ